MEGEIAVKTRNGSFALCGLYAVYSVVIAAIGLKTGWDGWFTAGTVFCVLVSLGVYASTRIEENKD